jgi:hypothetical protein
VLADVPPTAKCPKCRQRYVFREVLELHEFGAVIRFKCALLLSHTATTALPSAFACMHGRQLGDSCTIGAIVRSDQPLCAAVEQPTLLAIPEVTHGHDRPG